MSVKKNYVIERRYFSDVSHSWQKESEKLFGFTFEQACEEASKNARNLDKRFGDSHFWTVDLKVPDGGSYMQLFHGRLS